MKLTVFNREKTSEVSDQDKERALEEHKRK
jgi:hypothetical protein